MKTHIKIKSSLLLALASILAFLPACTEVISPSSSPGSSFLETPKDITGSWEIVQVSRNSEDITGAVDFSKFRLNLSDDNTYNIENYLPFIVSQDGNWSLDDPQYPFKITFETEDSAEPVVTDFNYPTVDGNRQIVLNFSPGCPSNSYEYVLQRVTE